MAASHAPLSLVMLGDVMLGRIVDECLSALPDAGLVWGDTLALLRGGMARDGVEEHQLVAGNLECAGGRLSATNQYVVLHAVVSRWIFCFFMQ